MTNDGKAIRLYLVPGSFTGILTTVIINRDLIIVALRTQLAELFIREEVGRTGGYCLVGSVEATKEISR